MPGDNTIAGLTLSKRRQPVLVAEDGSLEVAGDGPSVFLQLVQQNLTIIAELREIRKLKSLELGIPFVSELPTPEAFQTGSN